MALPLALSSPVQEDWEGAALLQEGVDVVRCFVADLVVAAALAGDFFIEVPDGQASGFDFGYAGGVVGLGGFDDAAVFQDAPEVVLGVGVVLLCFEAGDAGETA